MNDEKMLAEVDDAIDHLTGAAAALRDVRAALAREAPPAPSGYLAVGVRETLRDLVDINDCELDERGTCRRHYWTNSRLSECPHRRAKMLLGWGLT